MKIFCLLFPVSLKDFQGKYVLDVGCWTGGTTLLLNSLGSKVLALEEVNKYAKMTAFLVQSFALEDRIEVVSRSLYQWDHKDSYNKFDIVYFSRNYKGGFVSFRHRLNAEPRRTVRYI
jgi:tRNA1(Val) A37 N6-methylase TrmN6